MRQVKHMAVEAMDPHRFADVLTPSDYEGLLDLLDHGARELAGRVIWNVNSTHRGGGVAELLRSLIGYARGAGVDARWVVIRGTPEFFEATKRLHNHLHGFDGDAGVAVTDREVYERTLAEVAGGLLPLVRADDVVILHDPQTAGLIDPVHGTGATVIWRCHVGLDHPNPAARAAWDFLRGYVLGADAYVFSRASFAWDGLETERIGVVQPSIDAFSAKNQEQLPHESRSILTRTGILRNLESGPGTFVRSDGTPGRVDRRARMVEASRLRTEDRLVVQVSRWDRLKDPLGVMRSFAEHVAPRSDAHLLLAGPAATAVTDDPEGAGVLAEVIAVHRELPEHVRRRVHLASLPMVDVEENAAIVNALQRHAEIVVQKSLAEGFGLTVAEAMWKGRPVVASRIGGIQDQIVDGESGVLIDDPRDLSAFGAAVAALLEDRERAARIGSAAQARVRDHFLAPHHLRHYFELIHRLTGGPAVHAAPPDAHRERRRQ